MKQQHKKYLVKRSGVLTGGWLLVAFTWTSAVYSLASIPCSCIVIKMIDYWLLWVVWALAVGQLASCLTLDYFGVQMSSRSTQWLQCPVSAKQARLITPAPQRYSLTLSHLWWSFALSKHDSVHYGQMSPLWFIIPQVTVVVEMRLWNLRCAAMFSVERRAFFSGNSSLCCHEL